VVLAASNGTTVAQVVTNAAGVFAFQGLVAGAYTVQVTSTPFGPSRTINVNLSAGQNLKQDIAMRAASARQVTTSDVGSITSTVTDPSGAVVPGVRVRAARPALNEEGRNTLTDERGTYAFTSVPSGTYRVTATLPGFKTLNIDGVNVADQTLTVNASLALASVAEEITVQALVGVAGSSSTPAAPAPPCPDLAAVSPSTPPQTGGIRTGGSVQAARLLAQAKPQYPVEAKAGGIEGVVVFEAVIGKNGRIIDTRLITGQPVLAGAVTDAISHWCYSPTLLNGQAVETISTITVNFNLIN
jgi:TonB family protein